MLKKRMKWQTYQIWWILGKEEKAKFGLKAIPQACEFKEEIHQCLKFSCEVNNFRIFYTEHFAIQSDLSYVIAAPLEERLEQI